MTEIRSFSIAGDDRELIEKIKALKSEEIVQILKEKLYEKDFTNKMEGRGDDTAPMHEKRNNKTKVSGTNRHRSRD